MHLVDLTMFYAAEGGGVSTYLNAKSRWLARQGRMRHTILSPNVDRGEAPARLRVPGLALPGIHGYRMPLSVSAIARRLRALRPDLIEVGDAGHCAWAALRARDRLDVPAVAFYHSDLPRLLQNRFGDAAAGVSARYLTRLYARFDLVLAPSRRMVEQLQAMGVHGALHQPLGIDSAVFHPGRRDPDFKARLGLKSDVRLLVYAGRFTADKKLDVLLDALGRLGPGYHLLLVGAGEPLPMMPNTTLMPFQRDQRALARMLASCDLLVHPGDCETFGLIVLEAMGCGLPVVVTTGGGVSELVDDDCGVLARPNCADSLAGAIRDACARDLAALGAQARRKVERCFDWNQVFVHLMGRYEHLLANHVGSGHSAAHGVGLTAGQETGRNGARTLASIAAQTASRIAARNAERGDPVLSADAPIIGAASSINDDRAKIRCRS
ncbi:glycosyltransferase [Massilia sp.]|uniref:glycosyltransferase n=1 Tax=Massilia sp. TaxID=1882437 RepID=UPI0028A251C1|nr:glycosyltransferase [Massilia sp.]